MNLLKVIQETFAEALHGLVLNPAYASLVKPAQDPRFGDYQANCAMPLAKELGRKPREVAQELVQRLDLASFLEPPEIAGPGFINLRLRTDWLATRLQQMAREERLGVDLAGTPQTLVIDYSSPNVAKPMHVGHLRSTIIGAALARLFRFLGHQVITDNHLGDWGTQFGILLYGYKHFRDEAALAADPVHELARLYVDVRNLMAAGEEDTGENLANPVAEAARQETASLHAGDREKVRLWQMFMPWCLEDINRIYRRLDVQFDFMHGESFYHPMLPEVVRSLLDKGIAEQKEGAVVVYFAAEDSHVYVEKKDGAFTYMTSDLATIRYRVQEWHPNAILYVVGAPQALHFRELFELARRLGYTQPVLEHIAFGSVLGSDRRPFRTREGGTIELNALLDEAVARASAIYEQSRQERRERGEEVPELDPAERARIAEVVGLGAVKYADLSQNRTSDYVFNWDKMLAMDGNTATYMQYAYARIRSIFRKGHEDEQSFRLQPPIPDLQQPHERTLALQLLRLQETLEAAAADYKPNIITAYLWDLAKSYSGFYQNCPVLKAETTALRQGRLLLCDLTARAIQLGLGLLGIQTVERM
jgi:arginyl-tRNA synthetase